MEDLAIGEGQILQKRGTGTAIDMHIVIPSYADLIDVDTSKYTRARVYAGSSYLEYKFVSQEWTISEAVVTSYGTTASDEFKKTPYSFSVLADLVSTIGLEAGKDVYVHEREAGYGGGAWWSVVPAGEATDNGINVLANLTTGVKLVLREGGTVNVRSLGVLPIVGRDNKAALDKAFEKWYNVYIPRGNYTSSTLEKLTNNVRISGDGWSNSRIDLKAGELGTLLDTSGVVATVTDVRLFGGLTSTQKANEVSTAARDGLKWATQNGSIVQRCKIDGFQRYGVNGGDAANGLWERSTCDNNIIINNWQGVNTGGAAGEYARYTNNEIKSNYFGIPIRSGNIIVNDNHIDKNGIGVFFDGTLPNDGHGNFMGNTLNHNTYPVFARNIDNGYNCLGNQIFEGIIRIENCVAFKISAGQINVNKFELIGTGQNYIYSNQMFASYGNVIERSVSNGTLIYDNFFPDGSYLEGTTSRSIVIQEAGASIKLNGLTSYPKFHLEATVATSTKFSFEQTNDGLLWDNNNATKDYYWGSSGVAVAKIDAGTGKFESLPNSGGFIAKSANGTRYQLVPPNGGGAATWVAV